MDLGDRLAFHIRWTIPAENFCVVGSDSLSKNMKKKNINLCFMFSFSSSAASSELFFFVENKYNEYHFVVWLGGKWSIWWNNPNENSSKHHSSEETILYPFLKSLWCTHGDESKIFLSKSECWCSLKMALKNKKMPFFVWYPCQNEHFK